MNWTKDIVHLTDDFHIHIIVRPLGIQSEIEEI